MTTLFLRSIAALAASAGLAAADTTEAEVAQLLSQIDGEVEWIMASEDETGVVMTGLSVTVDDTVLRASSAMFTRWDGSDDGPIGVEIAGASMRLAEAGDDAGRIDIARLQGRDARLLGLVARRGGALNACPAGTRMAQFRIQAQEVALVATQAMMPADATAPESISADGVTMTVRLGADDLTCGYIEEVRARDMQAAGFDGSTAELALLELAIGRGSDTDLTLALEALRARDAAGTLLLSVDDLAARIMLEAEVAEALGEVALTDAGDRLAELFLRTDIPQARLALEMSALYLPLGTLLPADMRARAGLEEGSEIAGDAALQLDTRDARIILDQRIDLAGLMRSAGRVELNQAEPPENMSDVFESDAQLDFLAALRLASAEMSFEDDGLNAMVTAARGDSVPALLAGQRDAIEARIPAAMRGGIGAALDGVIAWVDTLFDSGGAVHVQPQRPVGLMDLGLAAMMRPDSLPDMLGLRVE